MFAVEAMRQPVSRAGQDHVLIAIGMIEYRGVACKRRRLGVGTALAVLGRAIDRRSAGRGDLSLAQRRADRCRRGNIAVMTTSVRKQTIEGVMIQPMIVRPGAPTRAVMSWSK